MTSYPATYANIGPALATLFNDKIQNQIMRAIAGRLTQDELLALAAYYESLKPTK